MAEIKVSNVGEETSPHKEFGLSNLYAGDPFNSLCVFLYVFFRPLLLGVVSPHLLGEIFPRFQSVLVNFSLFFPRFQSGLVNFSQFQSVFVNFSQFQADHTRQKHRKLLPTERWGVSRAEGAEEWPWQTKKRKDV